MCGNFEIRKIKYDSKIGKNSWLKSRKSRISFGLFQEAGSQHGVCVG